jgi:hypothetical protein
VLCSLQRRTKCILTVMPVIILILFYEYNCSHVGVRWFLNSRIFYLQKKS